MKFSIVILGLCAITVAVLGQKEGEVPESLKVCLKKLEATWEELEKFLKGEDVPKLMCLWECVMREDGSMSADGDVDEDKTFANLPPNLPNRDETIAAIKACIGEKKGSDDCDTANIIYECIKIKMPKEN